MREHQDRVTASRRRRRAAAAAGAAVLVVAALPAAGAAVGIDLVNPVAAATRASLRALGVAPAAERCAPDCGSASAAAAASPSSTAAPPTETATAQRGTVASIVAACAPRGQDPLFSVTGDLSTHGDFVRAAAAGHTLALPFGSFDLASTDGARSLCAALAAQRAALPSAAASSPRDRATPRPGDPHSARPTARQTPRPQPTAGGRTAPPSARPPADPTPRGPRSPQPEPTARPDEQPTPDERGRPSEGPGRPTPRPSR